jgi:DNA-binding MarR family transcriptional regulator
VRRVVSEEDRRARELSLTAKGKSIRAALQPIVKELQNKILLPLGEADQELMINLVRQVVWNSEYRG